MSTHSNRHSAKLVEFLWGLALQPLVEPTAAHSRRNSRAWAALCDCAWRLDAQPDAASLGVGGLGLDPATRELLRSWPGQAQPLCGHSEKPGGPTQEARPKKGGREAYEKEKRAEKARFLFC